MRMKFLSVSRMVKIMVPVIGAALALAFAAGSIHGRWSLNRKPDFHDLRINHVVDFMGLIDLEDDEVQKTAAGLGSPENAYYFVRDRIRFDPSCPTAGPGDILREKRASCLGKAILLCSLYRAIGLAARDVRVVTGEVVTPNAMVEHAWLEMEYRGRCLQQDATNLLGTFSFDHFSGDAFTKAFIRKQSFCFNDHGFAVVSQLNGIKDWHPDIPSGP